MASQTKSASSPDARTPNGAPQNKTSLEKTADGHPRFYGCSNIKAYDILSKLGEGTFGEVYKAKHKHRGNAVALKKILMHNEKDGFPITALREIKLLKMLSHPNILKLEEMACERSKTEGRKKATMYMVTPYFDHDLSGLLENPAVTITEPQIKCYMLQLLEGLRYLHDMSILHRDMKAANLLINNMGILQIADFGLARSYDDPPPVAGKGGGEATRDYTTLVVTRWYRPPELLLQLRRYTTAIDMWGVGCVFGEMFKGGPILAGTSDLNQIQMIFDLVGGPTEENMPGWSSLPGCEGVRLFKSRIPKLRTEFAEQGSLVISLLSEFLKLDWRKRINAIDALKHPYFTTPPLPLRPGDIPQFEESHELDRRKFRDQKAKLPPAPAGGAVGMGANGNWANGGPHNNNQHQQQHHPHHDSRRHPHGAPPPPPPPQINSRPTSRNGHADGRIPHNNSSIPHQRGGGGPSQDRRPAWQQQHRDGPPPPGPPRDLGLPPRPPPSNNMARPNWGGDKGIGMDIARMRGTHQPPPGMPPHGGPPPSGMVGGGGGGGRGPPPPPGMGGYAGGGGGGVPPARVDTYIPGHGMNGVEYGHGPPPPHMRRDLERDRDRERERGRYDQRPPPPMPGYEGGPGVGGGGQRRRSRSPPVRDRERDRYARDREWERDYRR
ncbi:serine/threonine protein kinase, CMGC, CDC2/CDK sub [Agyrium rufum]|nr:serine/threonine protein kinase, CMGC, CDC2/CDK sub [Agyrium rufum]